MTTDRHERASAEAERRWPGSNGLRSGDDMASIGDFVRGWLAADAHPQPHTITRGGYEHAKRMFGISPAETRQFLRALGIEVEDDDE